MEIEPIEDSPEKRLAQFCQQAAAYCAYQDRTQKLVIQKLEGLGANEDEIEVVIDWLIAEKFLDEQRFANSYTGGKFNRKKWGKLKIQQGLRLQGVDGEQVQESLNAIDPDEYKQTLLAMLRKKNSSFKSEINYTQRSGKLYFFAASKGYESSIIREVIREVLAQQPSDEAED